MRNRILPFGLIPALLASALMFTAADLPAQETAATKPESAATQTTTELNSASTTNASSAAATAGTCTKSCMDASGNLKTCKIVNNIPKYTCNNPINICSGACY